MHRTLQRLTQHYPHLVLFTIILSLPWVWTLVRGAPMPFSTWLNLTLGGLGMGMIFFIMASGMTLTFGLMDVMNMGHGAFITLGAYVGGSVMLYFTGWFHSDSLLKILAIYGLAIGAAMSAAGLVGFVFERVLVRTVYKDGTRQILATMGGGIIISEAMLAGYGSLDIGILRPALLKGNLEFGSILIDKYRLLALVVGLVIYAAMMLAIHRTKIGLLIRAGVEKPDMVEIFGYHIKRLFIAVFVAGAALAGLGGVMWGSYTEVLNAGMGAVMFINVIIIVIIGGMGSIRGCFWASLIVGLLNLYLLFLQQNIAEFSVVSLLIAVLMWRPHGLIPIHKG